MNTLIEVIEQLKNSDLQEKIRVRINEFKKMRHATPEKIFTELCFCILTANSTAERCIPIQKQMEHDFLTLSEDDLIEKLKTLRCRFHTTRAHYIVSARPYSHELINSLTSLDGDELREWLVEHIKGLGYKEASHFLRNIGYDDYAIVDFHIVNILVKHNLIAQKKTLNKQTYLEIEQVLKHLAEKTRLSLAELDLYLWYLETNKILK